MRGYQQVLRRRSSLVVQRSLMNNSPSSSSTSSSSINQCCSGIQMVLAQQRHKSSFVGSIVADMASSAPQSLRDSVKATILENVTRKDSQAWRANNGSIQSQANGAHQNGRMESESERQQKQQMTAGTINQSTSPIVDTSMAEELEDPLDQWYVDDTIEVKYWPDLPDCVSHSKVEADPFALGQSELRTLSQSIREDLLGSQHPVLSKAASYFFEDNIANGKRVRPLMVFLLSRALADATGSSTTQGQQQDNGLFSTPMSWQRSDLPDAQRRLGEISEMIHTASLVHDDVIDDAETRRGVSAVHTVFGNKVAILAGDYLLARASIYLARLRNIAVVESMSMIIEHLVRGEVMQLRGVTKSEVHNERLVYYLRKTFYKTGSLMANSCKSTALLGNYPPELVSASYNYGKHVGLAFQLVDDILDFEGNLQQLGKPSLSDLKSGLATAPVLFASEEFPQLIPMMERKFNEPGDAEQAYDYVQKSNGINRTKELAIIHAELAIDAITTNFGADNNSLHRDALIHLAHAIVSRTK